MGMTANIVKLPSDKLAEIQSDPSLVGQIVMDSIQGNLDAEDCLDLYKSWNALHVLLADEGFGAAADAVMGGTPVGDDLGYGPARMLTENQVSEISNALNKIETVEFQKHFHVEKMTDVYAFHPDDADEEWETLTELFEELKTFYAATSEQSNGMLLYLV